MQEISRQLREETNYEMSFPLENQFQIPATIHLFVAMAMQGLNSQASNGPMTLKEINDAQHSIKRDYFDQNVPYSMLHFL